jgi:hypothetical protein
VTLAPDDRQRTGDEVRYCRAADTLWRTTGSGVLVLPAGATHPMAVVGAGHALWEVLSSSHTADEAAAALAARFGVPQDGVRAAIDPVLRDLSAIGAVRQVVP